MQCLYNNNANTAITTSSNFCTLLSPAANILSSGSAGIFLGALAGPVEAMFPMMDLASYLLNPNASAGGTIVTFQSLEFDGTGLSGNFAWVNLSSPAPITLVNSTPVNGILNGPFLGLRILTSSAVGSTYARLSASVRSM